MEQYYFLFGLALVYVVFATIQDWRTREIANWLSFSLIAFVLAYRAFYAIATNDLWFFLFGIFGVVFFVILGYGLYYARAFAGGDAKLLFGFGGILPYTLWSDYITIGLGFIFILFLCGIIYTLAYSFFLVRQNIKGFKKSFGKNFKETKNLLFISLFLFIASLFFTEGLFLLLSATVFIVVPILYIYAKSLENACMINLVDAKNLTEGDWLDKDVKLGKNWIKKSVHGLTVDEIILLRNHKKKVWIKSGVPFAPAFLLALVAFYIINMFLS